MMTHSINKIKNKIYLFGSGLVAKKTINKFQHIKFAGIIDNSKNLAGQTFDNLKIYGPNTINKKNFYIITSTSFLEISTQLENLGLRRNINYIISPLLKDVEILSGLENLEKSFLITSGSPIHKKKFYGGGIYLVSLKGDSWNYKKIYNGNCYGIIKVQNKIFAVDENIGIIEFNYKLKKRKIYHIEKGLRPHGLAFCEISQQFFLCCTDKDQIIVFDKNFKAKNRILISEKIIKNKIKNHHVNDCIAIDGRLYVSMFSISGNFDKEIYDGSILEIDIFDTDKRNIITNNLWMPHNISYYDNSFHVLNSFKGELLAYNLKVIGKFPAFARGLDYDGNYYYVGQSRNRNFSKLLGDSLNISIDTGVIIFEPEKKLSRFLQLHPKLSEIHSVLLI